MNDDADKYRELKHAEHKKAHHHEKIMQAVAESIESYHPDLQQDKVALSRQSRIKIFII